VTRSRLAVRRSVAATVVALALSPAAALAAPAPSAVPAPAPVSITRALDLLESGSARRAVILGAPGAATLEITVGRRVFRTSLPFSSLAEQAVAAARAGHVPLSINPPRTPAPAPAPASEGGGFQLTAFLKDWGPIFLMAALVAVAALAVRQVGGARFKNRVRPVSSASRFDEVAGIDEIRDEVTEIADFLRDPVRYERLGATLPRGVILHGPPGTGKTLLARAVAGEAGVPFFSASGSEFVEVYSGLGSRRVRALFAAARKAAPAVVYIDEIDAVGAARTGHASSGEREQTLDQLLAEMDGFANDPTKPVVVLASTNRLADLDPALVRSGRFDRKIAVGLPGRDARRAILDVHTRRRPLAPGTLISEVAAFTAGLAGADLAALCNEASFEAVRAGRDTIDLGDFRRALIRLAAGPERRHRVLSDEERRLVAFHEIGHALVGHLLPRCDPVERVTVIPQGLALGVTISLPTEDKFLVTRQDCTERLTMLLAGRAAEELFFGEQTSGAADDLARAGTLARRMVDEFGMGQSTTRASLAAGAPEGAAGDERSERESRALLEEAYERARALLVENELLVRRAAERLLEAEALDRAEVAALLGPRPMGDRLRLAVDAVGGAG
jgi:cell division protease FtsH